MDISRLPLWAILVGTFTKRLVKVIMHGVDKTPVYEGFLFGNMFDHAFDSTVSDEFKSNPAIKEQYKKDAVRCYLRWGFTPRDYFLFGFHDNNVTTSVRKTFISDSYKDYALFSKEGPEKYAELYDKNRFLSRIDAAFLGNEGGHLLVNKQVSKEEFISFTHSFPDLFIKPNSSSYGNGAMTAMINNDSDAALLYDTLQREDTTWIVEKRIKQSVAMAKWNSSSVNTVRINTFLTDRGFFVLAPFLRTGRAGSIVDNGGKGGIYALINEQNGIILTNGRDESGGSYLEHPDSGESFKGESLPDWKDLINTVEMVHRNYMTDHVYISWDFAHTDVGWRIIEGNWGQFICQQSASHRGFKKEFVKYLKGHALNK